MRRGWRGPTRSWTGRRVGARLSARPSDGTQREHRRLRAGSLEALYADRSRGASECATCGGPFSERNPLTRGHQPPMARLAPDGTLDGQRVPLVVIAQCGRCNSIQGTRTIAEWRAGVTGGPHVAAAAHEPVISAERRLRSAQGEQRRERTVIELRSMVKAAATMAERLSTERGLRVVRWRVLHRARPGARRGAETRPRGAP